MGNWVHAQLEVLASNPEIGQIAVALHEPCHDLITWVTEEQGKYRSNIEDYVNDFVVFRPSEGKAGHFTNSWKDGAWDTVLKHVHLVSAKFLQATFLMSYHSFDNGYSGKFVICDGRSVRHVHQNHYARGYSWAVPDIFEPYAVEYHNDYEVGSLWDKWLDDIREAVSSLQGRHLSGGSTETFEKAADYVADEPETTFEAAAESVEHQHRPEERDLDGSITKEADELEVNFEKAKSDVPDEQDNIHTKDQIVSLLTDGAPSWVSQEKYPFLAGRTDLYSYKDSIVVAANDIEEVRRELFNNRDGEQDCDREEGVEYPRLYYTQSRFGAWGHRFVAYLVWRKKDWRIARELVAKMWNMRDERAIHDYYDCPRFGWDPDEQWEKAAEFVERQPIGGGAEPGRQDVAGREFHHRNDEDWAEFTSRCKAHPKWTLDMIARVFGVTKDYSMRLVGMYLMNTLPDLAERFPECAPEELVVMTGVFAEEYIGLLSSDWVADVVRHWGSIWRYFGIGAQPGNQTKKNHSTTAESLFPSGVSPRGTDPR